MSNFKIKTILAPMEGVTDFAIRNLMASRGGLDMVCTEFCRIHSDGLSKRLVRKAIVKSKNTQLSVQIMGREIKSMVNAALALEQAGADVIDINIGCPSRKALNGGVGSALLLDLKHLEKMLSALRKVITVPFSAKMRSGFDNSNDVLKIAKLIESTGIDFLTIHPRSSVQMYNGKADWQIIKLLKQNLTIPVIGNGDILSAEDAVNMLNITGCDGVMIGRGALRNPWIFVQLQQLKNDRPIFVPSGQDILNMILELHKSLINLNFPKRKQFSRLKANLAMIFKNIGDGNTLRRIILMPNNLEELLDVCHHHLNNLSASQINMNEKSIGLIS